MEEIYTPENNEADKVELYSRENNDILGDMPNWLIHTGYKSHPKPHSKDPYLNMSDKHPSNLPRTLSVRPAR